MADFNSIRAARGGLNWSRADLEREAGISRDAIQKIEEKQGHSPRKSTLLAIETAFLRHGVRLTEFGAEAPAISSYSVDGYLALLDDVAKTLSAGGELLRHCIDEQRSSEEVRGKIYELRAQGISMRSTISESNTFVLGNPQEYRTLPSSYFGLREVKLCYGDKVAHYINPGECYIICSDYLADDFRIEFSHWWDHGQVPDAP